MIVRRWRLHSSRQGILVGMLAISAMIVGGAAGLPAWAGPTTASWHAGLSEHTTSHILAIGYRGKRQSGDEEAAALFDEGQYELDSGFTAAAIRVFKTLVSRYPDSIQALKAQRILARLMAQQQPPRRSKPVPPDVRSQPLHSVTEEKQSLSVARRAPEAAVDAGPPDQFVHDTAQQYKLMQSVGDRVFFAPNSIALGAKARAAVRRQAAWLQRNGDALVEIVGHADEPGSQNLNMRMSQQRAEAVRRRLIAEGIDSARIRIVAQGRSQPVATCRSARCSAQNRRVITRLLRVKAVRPDAERSTVSRNSRR